MDFIEELFENACRIGDLETVEKLFDKFVNIVTTGQILHMRNLIVETGNLNTLEYFDQRGVDMNSICDDKTPLMIAARRGWVDITDFLLKIEVDINLKNVYGWTALRLAIQNRNTDVVNRLLETGQCDVNLENRYGETALFFAVEIGHLGIVDRLLAYGANYYHVNKDGENLLHYIIESENINMFQKLLSLGLDVNQQNNNGRTPLISAVVLNRQEIIKILLEHGADPMIKDIKGETALDLTNDKEIKNLLMKK